MEISSRACEDISHCGSCYIILHFRLITNRSQNVNLPTSPFYPVAKAEHFDVAKVAYTAWHKRECCHRSWIAWDMAYGSGCSEVVWSFSRHVDAIILCKVDVHIILLHLASENGHKSRSGPSGTPYRGKWAGALQMKCIRGKYLCHGIMIVVA
jgi:hypothetical protein